MRSYLLYVFLNIPGSRLQEASGDSEDATATTKSPLDWLKRLASRLRRPDEESVVCYALFVALFITDFSLLALLLQALLFCYALLAQPPARLYWQVRPPTVLLMTLHGDRSHGWNF